jgi:3-oxoacyl-[acyl-carrier protein] reductase
MSESHETDAPSRVALVTGVGRPISIGRAVARRLASDGYTIAASGWTPYDRRVHESVRHNRDDPGALPDRDEPPFFSVEADLENPETATTLFDTVESHLGPVSVLVMCHCESVDSGILDTTLESFDRHFAVNARATWQLIREFGRRFRDDSGRGRIIAFTSDHVVGNLPYGASKGALDRITLAAAHEFAHLGVRSNVINPGPTDTGWISPSLRERIISETPLARVGQPEDAANLVSFLCSADGAWINGQLLHSNGGFSH